MKGNIIVVLFPFTDLSSFKRRPAHVSQSMKDYEVGDSIHGQRIMAEARKANDPIVIVKSARPKAQRMVLTESAF